MPATPRSPMTAADVMTASPRTCSTFSSVLEAVMIFRDADCGAVPVLEEGKPIGVLTDRDVALALAEHASDLAALPVSQVMVRGPVISVRPDTPLDDVIEQFGDRAVRRLLVIDSQNRLVGIIGLADIAPHAPDRQLGEVLTEVVQQP